MIKYKNSQLPFIAGERRWQAAGDVNAYCVSHTNRSAWLIEDVVADTDACGKGVGRAVVSSALELARHLDVRMVLTARSGGGKQALSGGRLCYTRDHCLPLPVQLKFVIQKIWSQE